MRSEDFLGVYSLYYDQGNSHKIVRSRMDSPAAGCLLDPVFVVISSAAISIFGLLARILLWTDFDASRQIAF